MIEKIKNIKFTKKSVIISICVLAILLVLVMVLILTKRGISQEKKLTNNLKALGVEFYENFYYDQISSNTDERKEFLEKYTDIGIKINLDNLSRFKGEKIKEDFINDETNEECDRINSMVVIYPKEPYKKTSYSIDAILECGYEE